MSRTITLQFGTLTAQKKPKTDNPQIKENNQSSINKNSNVSVYYHLSLSQELSQIPNKQH